MTMEDTACAQEITSGKVYCPNKVAEKYLNYVNSTSVIYYPPYINNL